MNSRTSDRLKIQNASPSTLTAELSSFTSKLESKMTSIVNDVEDKIKGISVGVTDQLATVESRISLLQSELHNLLADFEKKLNQVLQSQIALVSSEISGLQSKVHQLENKFNDLERKQKAGDVILSGVPVLPNEDLHQMVSHLCSKLNISILPDKIFRTSRNKKNTSIIIKLKSTHDKILFMSAVRNYLKSSRDKKTLTLHDLGIGLQSNEAGNIYLNDSLTSLDYSIFRKALSFKKNNIIAAAYIVAGRVFIRKQKNDPGISITSIDELINLDSEI